MLVESDYNVVEYNNLVDNTLHGISLNLSDENEVVGNFLFLNVIGIYLNLSNYNYVVLNEFVANALEEIIEIGCIGNIFDYDDDTEAPVITVEYFGGYTDGDPGYIEVIATDNVGLSVDPSGIYYPDPEIIDVLQEWTFTATDNDDDTPDDSLTTVVTFSLTLTDDDTEAPVITIEYFGGFYDSEAGYVEVIASDNIGLIDDPSGIYYLDPSLIGIAQVFEFTITDNDNDRSGDSLSVTSEQISITLYDDDSDTPMITAEYFGGYTDGDPGYIEVIAWDNIGLSLDPSGIYPLDPTIIDTPQVFTFTATDNDNDWDGDSLSREVIYEVTLADDDTEGPEFDIGYDGDFTDGNPGTLYITVYDPSGISVYPPATIAVPAMPGPVYWEFIAIDDDNDRPGDRATKVEVIQGVLQDDDSEAPTITIEYYGGYTDGDPGYIIVTASDNVGLSVDPSGTYYPDPTIIGVPQVWPFIATDNDNDWVGDALTTVVPFSLTLTDDDTVAPVVNIEYFGGYTDGDPGYVEVTASDNVGLSEDPSGTYYLDPTIIDTPQIFTFTATDSDEDRPGDSLSTTSETLSITLTDDDTEAPVIFVNYFGSGTDEDPGYIEISASDNVGLSADPTGSYNLPNLPETLPVMILEYRIQAIDNDDDRPGDSLGTMIEVLIRIIDDDTEAPVIIIEYIGGHTDGNPGFVRVTASDNVGLSDDPTGDYPLDPNIINTPQVFTFSATDNDSDRPGDSLTTVESISITLSDDDTEAPIITLEYIGGDTDGDPGFVRVTASDNVGLSDDPTGDYPLDPTIINTPQVFMFTATDNDDERPGDSLTTVSETLSITLIDDDTEAPMIILEYIGGNTDGDPGFVRVTASDNVGLSDDPTGDYPLDPTIINIPQVFTFDATDNDDDRPGDSLTTTSETLSITLTDDDVELPIITFTEDLYSWDSDLINLLFTIIAVDVDSGVSETVIEIAGQTFYGAGTHSVSLPSDFYTLEIWVTDDDYDRPNDALTKYEFYDLIFDLTPPITTAIPIGTEGLSGWFTSAVTVEMTAVDDTSGVACTIFSIDGSAWDTESGSFSIPITKEGISVIEYFSVDNMDNEEMLKTLTVKIDRVLPFTIHTLQPATPNGYNEWYVTPVLMTLFPDDITSGVVETYYRINGEPEIDYTGPVLFSVDNIYTVEYWSIDEAGLVEGVTTVHFKIDQTKPITSLTIGEPKHSSNPTYVSTETEFSLDAVDNLLGSGVKDIWYKLDSGLWQTYDIPFTIDSCGSHTIFYYSIDKAGNEDDIKTKWVQINLSELTYWGELSGVYSDPVRLKARLIDMATQLGIPDKFIVFQVGSQIVSAQTDDRGIASAKINLTQPGGIYTVSASFEEDDYYLPSSVSHSFTIEKEHAYLYYTGHTVIPTTAETIELRATVFEDDDGYWGDLNKIFVIFTVYPTPLDLLNPKVITESILVEFTNVDGVGVATIEIPTMINGLFEGGYLIKVSLTPDENYYHQAGDSDLAILTIYEPSGDFVTGGGWIIDSDGNKANFGFNVKYKKSGLPKGQAIFVYREGDWEYIFKSTAWIGMAIIHEDNHSYFEAKCVVQQYNSKTGELVASEGNFRMRIDVYDHTQNGKGDVFQIRVYDKIGLIYYMAGFDPYGILGGGNIVIHVDKKK
jgi:hypothetical protein